MAIFGYYLVAFVLITGLLGYVAYLIHKDAFSAYLLFVAGSFFNFTIFTFEPVANFYYFDCPVTISPKLSFLSVALILVLIFGKTNHKIGAGLFYLQWLLLGILAFLAFAPAFC